MSEILLKCENLSKSFIKNNTQFDAVKNVNLSIYKGECYGLVGESGCGKSTLSSLICGLQNAENGRVIFDEKVVFDSKNDKILSKNEFKSFRKKCQIVFQDPYASLNPKMKIAKIIEEPLKIHKIGKNSAERSRLVNEIRTVMGLPPDVLEKFPSELSGGQRQRVAIASSMILNPEFVICDESVSALDVLVQAQILNLLKKLQKFENLTYLFISHNLNVVAYMADRIGVMYKGEIVEEGKTEEILKNPKHFYTKQLIEDAGINID